MPRIAKPLTDTKCRQTKAPTKGSTRLFDGGGLYLEIKASGAKKWRMRYWRPAEPDGQSRENRLTFGDYPAVGIARARECRRKVQKLIDAGQDPADSIQALLGATAPAEVVAAAEPETSFRHIASDFLLLRKGGWSEGYHERISNTLEANAYPYFGKKDVAKVTGLDVLTAARKIVDRGARDMADRFLSATGMVCNYAVGIGKAPSNVVTGLSKLLSEKPPVQHFPHVREDGIGALLDQVRHYHGRPETKLAIQILMRTFPRTNELRWGEWKSGELDLERGLWKIPAERMKGTKMAKLYGQDHWIPLSRQAVALFRELYNLTGQYRFMFPGIRNSHRTVMNAETINKALKIMGFEGEQTGHGFRGLAATIMTERSGIRDKVIDLQLAHKKRKDKEGETKAWKDYDHAQLLDERRELMQWWSDYLDAKLSEFEARLEARSVDQNV